ncbi:MAG: DNA adenine methylase [Desulfovibrionaceae bacterium]
MFDDSPMGKVQPLIKWAGGKEKELKFIIPSLPQQYENYFEPFVGGGAVFTAVQPSGDMFLNDKSYGLVNLYTVVQEESFYACCAELMQVWEAIAEHVQNHAESYLDWYSSYAHQKISVEVLQQHCDALLVQQCKILQKPLRHFLHSVREGMLTYMQHNLLQKIVRMRSIEQKIHRLEIKDVLENIESGLKSGFYTACRAVYNDIEQGQGSAAEQGVLFFFVHSMAYSGMFRYNAQGRFNVPYGGIGYNRKNFAKKMAFLRSDFLQRRLADAVIANMDFESFLHTYEPQERDFVFLDPPYDSDFSTYLQNTFTQEDHQRLANYLLKRCKAQWMLVIKSTPFIVELYANKGLSIQAFDKKYLVSFMNRNDKNAEHLLIRSYH